MPCNLSIPYITYILPLAIYKLCQAAELVLPVHYTSLLYKPLQMAKSDYYKFYQKCTRTEYSSVLSHTRSSKFFGVLNSQIVQRIRGQSIQARGSFQNGALQKFQALQLTQEDHFWTCKSRGFFSSVKGATSRCCVFHANNTSLLAMELAKITCKQQNRSIVSNILSPGPSCSKLGLDNSALVRDLNSVLKA